MLNVQQDCAPTHTTTLKNAVIKSPRSFIGNYVHISTTVYNLARQKTQGSL